MKTIKCIFVLLIILALFFCFGSVGSYEAGTLSLEAFLGCSGGSLAVVWASFAYINKDERRQHNDRGRAQGEKHI